MDLTDEVLEEISRSVADICEARQFDTAQVRTRILSGSGVPRGTKDKTTIHIAAPPQPAVKAKLIKAGFWHRGIGCADLFWKE